MKLENVRTRFAPSPTGMLHFGNANTALFNWMVARRYGGKVILRVEDTDTERSTKEFEQKIIDDLQWLGIDWDEGPDKGGDYGPYRQSERNHLYEEYLNKLYDAGMVYRCYCTKEELEIEKKEALENKKVQLYSGKCRDLTPDDWKKFEDEGKPYVVRFKTPKNEKVIVKDIIRGDIEFDTRELEDFIIIRSNKVPIFLLTNAIDDALMGITHVVRGEDHISNTPKQILINKALGLSIPEYLHTAIILGPDRTKLSKRHGAVSVYQFREKGYIPESMLNYLAFLGWNPKDEREFFSREELIKEFSIENMSKAPSVFDETRLNYMNAHWMTRIDRDRVYKMCVDHLIEKKYITEAEAEEKQEWLKKIVEIAGDRVKITPDIEDYSDFFFKEVDDYNEKGVKKYFKVEGAAENLRMLASELEQLDVFDCESIEKMMYRLKEEKGLGAKQLIHPTRLSITGKIFGPGLFELMELLGKEKCIERMRLAAEWIDSQPAEEN
ncbi:MAG TPA: glutamate--tRNA ligase [bacterium]|nr:glutamate--tRNA ligase [bacterium]